jgi:hypothetical protein
MSIIGQSKTFAKPSAFYVPRNLDPRIIPCGCRMYAAYLLNLIHWRWICWRADSRGFVRLKHDYITRVVPPEIWPSLRDTLEAAGVIDVDRRYRPGAQCYGYRLQGAYCQARRIVCTNDTINVHIAALYARDRPRPVHDWLAEKLDYLDFDLPRAERIIATMMPDSTSTITTSEYRQLLLEAARRIAAGDLPLTCDVYGRVHTPVTSLVSELRCCLSVGDRTLVGIDLANSQPLIAGIVARQYFHDRTAAHRLRTRRYAAGNPYRRLPADRGPCSHADVERFISICEKGQVYESMMLPGDDRDRVKRAFLTMMYGRSHWRDSLTIRFAQQYPSVAEMFTSLKRRNYRHAAHLMQNVEATIFIDRICGRIRRDRPGLLIFTIHDSIVTTLRAADYVEETIRDEFRRLGVSATVKREHYQ